MVSSLLMPRRLRCCHDDVVALVAMVSLPLLMRRRLAVVDGDGDGATGNNDDNDVEDDGAMGDNNNND